jgi:hypothetical protein
MAIQGITEQGIVALWVLFFKLKVKFNEQSDPPHKVIKRFLTADLGGSHKVT